MTPGKVCSGGGRIRIAREFLYMQARGFTLVEIIVVICIISILLAIGTLKFSEYARRYRTEAQTRMIYTELLQARANAIYQRRVTRITLYPERFEVYSSATDGSLIAPVVIKALQFPIIWNALGDKVDFDERGLALNARSICIAGSDLAGVVDSVVIADTRVSIGKKKQGKDCDRDYITFQ